MSRTKIVCTLGPSSDTRETIGSMLDAGMNVARLNFSHGTRDDHERYVGAVRNTSKKLRKHVGIMQDLQGPRFRVSGPAGGLRIGSGTSVTMGGPDAEIQLSSPGVLQLLDEGDRVLIDGGLIELVLAGQGDVPTFDVITGGTVTPGRGVNLPDTTIDLPPLTGKDLGDLRTGVDLGVDIIALSFVQRGDDIRLLRDTLEEAGSDAWIVAKIERRQAVEDIDDILRLTDGIMIARGDLGVEMTMEEVPRVQKRLIERANERSRFVITATQMLESMMENPVPTRAEVSDVANAIIDGSDAIMLSGETAVGKYPVESVTRMQSIARETEQNLENDLTYHIPDELVVKEAVSHTACVLATNLEAKRIVAFTGSGSTARRISKYRHPIPVDGFTPSEAAARRMSILWGVAPHVVGIVRTTDEIFEVVDGTMKQKELADTGDLVLVVAGLPIDEPGTTNMVKAHQIG